MGSCISKGKEKKKAKEQDCNHADDKHVISHPFTFPSPHISSKVSSPSISRPPTITSTPSLSSTISSTSSEFSTTSSTSSSSTSSSNSVSSKKERSSSYEFLMPSSSSSSSSSFSNSISSKQERSFSDEYSLRSCPKSLEKSSMAKRNIPRKIESSPSKRSTQVEQWKNQERRAGSTPKQRARSNSSMVVQQKSTKQKEPDERFRAKRSSPSPSRRFNTNVATKHSINCNINSWKSSTVVKKDIGENHNFSRRETSFNKNMESFNQEINSRIVETRVEELQTKKDMDSIDLMEEINNPHIALDCFIFL